MLRLFEAAWHPRLFSMTARCGQSIAQCGAVFGNLQELGYICRWGVGEIFLIMKRFYFTKSACLVVLALCICFPAALMAETFLPESVGTSPCKGWHGAPAHTRAGSLSTDLSDQPEQSEESDNEDAELPEDAPRWKVSYSQGVVSVTWLDLVANCCVEFKSTLTREGDTLLFEVMVDEDSWPPCDCICPYDIEARYSGIEPGTYRLVLYNYNNGIEVYSAPVELTEGAQYSLAPYTTGVGETGADNRLSFHGNVLKVGDLTHSDTLRIYNADGVLMAEIPVVAGIEVSVTHLPAGVYVAMLQGQRTRLKFRIGR